MDPGFFIKFMLSQGLPQVTDQSEKIDLAPRLRNLAILNPIDHEPGEFD